MFSRIFLRFSRIFLRFSRIFLGFSSRIGIDTTTITD